MKRIISVLTVMAIMAAMLAVTATSAFAAESTFGQCHKLISQGVTIPIPGADSHSAFNANFNPPKSQGNQPGDPLACGK